MKIKLDENLPTELCDLLGTLGHAIDSVHDEGLRGHPDTDVWSAAQAEERFLITQDLDFSDARKYEPGTHPGILLVRLRDPTRSRLINRVWSAFQAADVLRWAGCIVVLSENRIRIRGPSN